MEITARKRHRLPFSLKRKREEQIKAPGKVTRCDNNRELGGIKAFPALVED